MTHVAPHVQNSVASNAVAHKGGKRRRTRTRRSRRVRGSRKGRKSCRGLLGLGVMGL